MATVGYIGVAVGFVGSLGGLISLAMALYRHQPERHRDALRWVGVMLGGVIVSVVVMEIALVSDDFSFAYVAGNSTIDTPLVYKMATLWGALEGSILFWAFILSVYVGAAAFSFRSRINDRLVAWSLLTMLAVCVFFFYLLLRPADPFGTLDVVPADGNGLNPLLRNHPLMAIHPVMLYLGYVGFTVPFSFAVGALVTGRLGEGWLVATRAWTMIAWGCLSLGIVLGAWWSYEVLGWGGYWAWDPVENASFLPWLTGTAYVHSVIVQERRGMLRVWNLCLLLATFALTIFGTFLTRSGVIRSVHEFGGSTMGPLLLAFFGLIVLTSVLLVGWRGDRLRSPGSIDSPVSREGSFLANNFLFAAFAFIVLLGTVAPLVVEALTNDRISIGRPYFDRMLMPVGISLLFLMGVSPMLTWRSTSFAVLRERTLGPAAAGAVTMAIAALGGATGFFEMVGLGLGGFVIGGAVRQLWLGLRRQGWRGATGRTGGGMIAHIGVALIAFGFIASTAYSEQGEFTLEPGETASVAGRQVRFLELSERMDGPNRVVSAQIDIEGRGVYAPAVTRFPTFGQPISTPSVSSGFVDDVYLVLTTLPEAGDTGITLRVLIRPLVPWMWVGGLLLALGTVLALIPHRRRAEAETPVPTSTTDSAEEPEPEGASA